MKRKSSQTRKQGASQKRMSNLLIAASGSRPRQVFVGLSMIDRFDRLAGRGRIRAGS